MAHERERISNRILRLMSPGQYSQYAATAGYDPTSDSLILWKTDELRVLDQYSPTFLDQMINVTTASTVICYALYAVAPETTARLGTRYLIATLPLVLYGIFRYLYLLYQRPGPRNPTEAILRDAPFLANLALWAGLVVALVYGG